MAPLTLRFGNRIGDVSGRTPRTGTPPVPDTLPSGQLWLADSDLTHLADADGTELTEAA